MALEVKVPTVGESINEVTIANWTKNDGDYVEMDEVIAELESEKTSFELTAPQAGSLKIRKKAGEAAAIGEVLCEIDEGAAKPSSGGKSNGKVAGETKPEKSKAASTGATGEVKEMKVPAVGESINEVTISSWTKKDGDFVKLDEVIAEVESEKATFDLPAEATGILRIVAKEKETIPIGALICKIEVREDVPQTEETGKKEVAPQAAQSGGGDKGYAAGHASPAAAKTLAEKGIASADVKGSGVGGRITKEDAAKATPGKKEQAAGPGVPAPVNGMDRNVRRNKMTSLRKTIARRLVGVKNQTAMLTTFNEVDMKPVMDLRSQYKEKFKEKYNVGLGFMSFFTKAVCIALKEWPAVNAQIDGDELVYHDYCDISIAVSTPKGLVVPVIRNAESLNFAQIESEVIRLATRGRDGKLSIEEMTGGTFSITNGGVFGSMLSTPIINPPQSAILGMHNIVERPIVKKGEVVVRPIMFLALSYDHRVIDGRESVSFLVRVKELLEDPGRLLIEI